jgi:beta-lactamase superfamily II metal-dependent hydrolase
MATKKTGLRVRMYRVGFGDFFLMTVPSDDGPKHVLIDCGVTPGTTHNGDVGTIKDAVAHMAKETKNQLALIIVTHRHMDHIIGFSRSAEIFSEMKVEAIWMPFWEAEQDDVTKFQADLTSLAMDVQTHLALNADENDVDAQEMLAMLRNATGLDDDELMGLGVAGGGGKGTGGGTNAKSLALLKTGLGVQPQYYKKGDKPKLPKSLKDAGLEAVILGPPPPDAIDFMKLDDLKKGVGQYLGDDATKPSKVFAPFGSAWQVDASAYPPSAFREWAPRNDEKDLPSAAQRVADTINKAQPAMLLSAVKEVEHHLNNQSLVVLFKFQGKNLLFAGDAQAGNWEYWMYGGTPTKAPSLDDLTAEGKRVLGNLDLYKVGHHGSTNATPITAVEAMGGKFASMCSTQRDTYGNPVKGTEVPRDPLMEALAKKSKLLRSDDTDELFIDYKV